MSAFSRSVSAPSLNTADTAVTAPTRVAKRLPAHEAQAYERAHSLVARAEERAAR